MQPTRVTPVGTLNTITVPDAFRSTDPSGLQFLEAIVWLGNKVINAITNNPNKALTLDDIYVRLCRDYEFTSSIFPNLLSCCGEELGEKLRYTLLLTGQFNLSAAECLLSYLVKLKILIKTVMLTVDNREKEVYRESRGAGERLKRLQSSGRNLVYFVRPQD